MSNPIPCCLGATRYSGVSASPRCLSRLQVPPEAPQHFLGELPVEILQEILVLLHSPKEYRACSLTDRYLNYYLTDPLVMQVLAKNHKTDVYNTAREARCLARRLDLLQRASPDKHLPPCILKTFWNVRRNCLTMPNSETIVCVATVNKPPIPNKEPQHNRVDFPIINLRGRQEEYYADVLGEGEPATTPIGCMFLTTQGFEGQLYISFQDGSARIWDPKTKQTTLIPRPPVLLGEQVTTITSLHGRVVACFNDNTVRIWSPARPAIIKATLPPPAILSSPVASTPDPFNTWVSAAPLGKGSLALGSLRGQVAVWRVSAAGLQKVRHASQPVYKSKQERTLIKVAALNRDIFIAFSSGPIEIHDSTTRMRTISPTQLSSKSSLHDFIILKGLLFCLSQTKNYQFCVQVFSPGKKEPVVTLPTDHSAAQVLGTHNGISQFANPRGVLLARQNTVIFTDPCGFVTKWNLDPPSTYCDDVYYARPEEPHSLYRAVKTALRGKQPAK